MNLTELSDQEKSVALAKAMGQKPEKILYKDYDDTSVTGAYWDGMSYRAHPNLYDPANMAMAWRCHLWAIDVDGPWAFAVAAGDFSYEDWLYRFGIWSQTDAQRLWLDKILELAIEAGLIEEEQHNE